MPGRFLRLFLALSVTAALSMLIHSRQASRGQWLPEVPSQLGIWEVQNTPLDEDTLALLGQPRSQGYEFQNPLDEQVFCQIVATATFDAFQSPRAIQIGYDLTATRQMKILAGGKPVLAQVYKQKASDLRVLMYIWVQDREGNVTLAGTQPGAQNNLVNRLLQGARSAWDAEQSCIFRVYATVHPMDRKGMQARRNLTEVSRRLYESTQPVGGRADTRGRP